MIPIIASLFLTCCFLASIWMCASLKLQNDAKNYIALEIYSQNSRMSLMYFLKIVFFGWFFDSA